MRLKLLLIALICLLIASCKNEVAPSTNQIILSNLKFVPNTVTVPVGTTITWTNNEAPVHTVTSDAILFDSGDLLQNKSFSYKFTTAGTVPYHCNYHGGMTGTIIVQ